MMLRLFNRLSGKLDTSRLPSRSGEIGDYLKNFEHAVRFTRSCGFKEAPPNWIERDLLDTEGTFIEPAFRAAGVVDPAMAAGQCLKWCHYLAPHFERQIGAKVWVTIGQLWNGDQPIFSPTWSALKRWARTGITLGELQAGGTMGINLHAWLTVESGEIIEPTFGSSLAAFAGDAFSKFRGAVAWGRDPHVLNRHRYFPMAVGQAFAEAIGSTPELPLLATDAADLHRLPVFLVASTVDR
ncbi:hypothetical protein [Pseudomonas aeruginosa]|uniref:hypothetical protein n=1 Tax=Pseudomonas aeruginosa TaxID=287 RepID=UPI0015C56E64|nr:hypothetical protein [Pseudomonas aeruginosa]NPW38035.1 hypothetical protein [Pseudomonas aeruginosa]